MLDFNTTSSKRPNFIQLTWYYLQIPKVNDSKGQATIILSDSSTAARLGQTTDGDLDDGVSIYRHDLNHKNDNMIKKKKGEKPYIGLTLVWFLG